MHNIIIVISLIPFLILDSDTCDDDASDEFLSKLYGKITPRLY